MVVRPAGQTGTTPAELGDKRGAGYPLTSLAEIALDAGDLAGAQQLHERALALRSTIGDKQGRADSHTGLADVARRQGRVDAARAAAAAPSGCGARSPTWA